MAWAAGDAGRLSVKVSDPGFGTEGSFQVRVRCEPNFVTAVFQCPALPSYEPGSFLGRPRLGRGPAAAPRPASLKARRKRNSIWALVLRSSSDAHRASASWTDGSSRSRTLLRSGPGTSGTGLVVERPGVDDGLCAPVATQHYKEVGDHRGLAFFVELDDPLLGKPGQRHLDHPDRTVDEPGP